MRTVRRFGRMILTHISGGLTTIATLLRSGPFGISAKTAWQLQRQAKSHGAQLPLDLHYYQAAGVDDPWSDRDFGDENRR